MRATLLTWKTGGEYRGVTITAGGAYVGELVQVLHDNLATDICVTTRDDRVAALGQTEPRA